MRTMLSLSVVLTALAVAACEYTPAPRGTAEESYSAPAADRAAPDASVPQHGDSYFETAIGRYDLDRDR